MNTFLKNYKYYFFLLLMLCVVSCNNDDDNDIELEQIDSLQLHKENLKSINIEGDNLTYLEYGFANPKTIILLHGVPTSSFLYRKVAEELANESGFRVIALDLLGFGESDKPTRTGAYNVDEQAGRIFKFADSMGINNFVLGFHDSGGPVGLRMLLDTQVNRILGLLITNTNNSLSLDGFTAPTPVAPLFDGTGTPRTVWSNALGDATSQRNTASDFITDGIYNKTLVTDALIDAYAAPLTQPETYIELFETLGPFLLDPTLNSVYTQFGNAKPVALLWGKEDAYFDNVIIPNRFQGQFSIPNKYMMFLENTGHYLQEDSPKEYVDFVSDFLINEF